MAGEAEVTEFASALAGGTETSEAETSENLSTETEEVTPPEVTTETEAIEPGMEAVAEPGEEEVPEPGAEKEPAKEEVTEETIQERIAKAQSEAEEKSLVELYRDSPQLKEFLKQAGNEKLRYQFFRAAEMNKMFPTVAVAKEAHKDALQLAEIDQNYYGDRDGKESLLDFLYDEDVDSETGQPQGHYAELIEAASTRFLGSILESKDVDPTILAGAAARVQLKPEEFTAMLQVVGAGLGLKGFTLGGGEMADAAGAKPKPVDARFAKEREEFETEKKAFEAERQKEFTAGIQKEMSSWTDKLITERLQPATALAKNPGLMKMVAKSARDEIISALDDRNDPGAQIFNTRLQQLQRSGRRGPELHDKIVAHLQQRVRSIAPGIVNRLLKEAGFAIVSKEKEKAGIRAQAGARKEPAATGTPGKLSAGTPAPTKPGGYISRNDAVEDLAKIMRGS